MASPIGISAGNFAPSGNSKNAIAIMITLVVLIIVIIVVKRVFGGLDGLLEMLNLKDSKEEKKAKDTVNNNIDKANDLGNQSAWSAKLYKLLPPGSKIFTQASADKLCSTIYGAIGNVYDEPNKIAGAIKQCYTKSQVSFLVDRFQAKYGNDLLSWLELHLDTSEQKKVLANILTYVENLPLSQPK
jgi:hypothetical protein